MSSDSSLLVLVVTAELDPHADAVQDALDELGAEYFRLHPRTLLTDYEIAARAESDGGWKIEIEHCSGRRIELPRERLVGYFRKPQPVEPNPRTRAGDASEFGAGEGSAFIRGLLRMPGIRWFPAPDAIRAASAKLPQLAYAQAAGMRIPASLVTRSPSEAVAFAGEHGGQVICKRLGAQPVLTTERLVLYTNRVSAEDLERDEEAISQAPVLLQEEIEKEYELRVVVIGTEVIACRIDSQSNERSQVDWRIVDPFDLQHEIVKLPPDTEAAVRRFLSDQSLDFAVLDLALTPDGHYVFFENNPNGQWYWIELITGFPLAERVARYLKKLASPIS